MRRPIPLFIALGSLILLLTLREGVARAEEMEDLPENTCVECHADLDEARLKDPVKNWNLSVHKKAGVACNDCHGGDPSSYDEAMEEKSGFLGKPKKEEIPGLCARCHSDAKKMRIYNLRTDQYALYRQSMHGRRLFKHKDPKAATCVDCHGNHAVFSKKDPRSPVYRPNIIKTCSTCHSDASYMKEYKIPTSQYEGYLQSYHGRLLLEKNDPRVPTCADCHSAHGAVPAGVKTVAEVCGNCHSVTAEYYSRSRHSQVMKDGGKPWCTDCHGRHRILFPTGEKFTGAGEYDCRACHEPGSSPFQMGARLKNMLARADRAIQKEITGVKGLKSKGGTGFEISRLTAELDKARAGFTKTVAMTHTLRMPDLTKRVEDISGITGGVHDEIASIYRELRVRYLGLIVTWVFLLLFMWVLNEKRKGL